MNIFETMQQETATIRHRTAVIEGTERITYGELLAAAEQVAGTLRNKGVGRFHRVGLLCGDSMDYIIASLAILSLSAAIVPISPDQSVEEIADVISRIDLEFIVAESRYSQCDWQPLPLSGSGFIRKEFCLVAREATAHPPVGYCDINPAFIRFSSGTTGASKGVVLSHETIIDRTDAADKGMRITSDDVVLWVLSMSFHFVVSILLFLRRGATIVLCSQRFPDALIEGVTEHKGTFIYASPFHYNLLAQTDLLSGESLKQFRMAISTAMKLPNQVAEVFAERFGFELSEAYGIIEVGLPFIKLSGKHEKRGSVGRALSGYEIRLDTIDEDGIGEILIKGKGMLDAYYSPWQGRSEIMDDGWFRTGDLGKIDTDGFLFIVGRNKDVINFAGMKIFAQEVESVINQHPDVQESLVYGTLHPSYGELPTAKVVLVDGSDPDAVLESLRRFCYQKLAQYKAPKEYIVVGTLEKTASGKIKR